MQSLTLQDLFGGGAVQTATEFVIKKADLAAVGLTPTANNRAEQLLVAILLQALSVFQAFLIDEAGDILSDDMGNAIGYDNRELYELLEMFRWHAYAKKRKGNLYLIDTIVIHSYVQTD